MLTAAVKEKLAEEVQLWLADGLISPQLAQTLRGRYGARTLGLALIFKYLGIAGGLFAFLGLLGLLAAASGSKLFGGLLVLAVGAAFLAAGIRLDRDVNHRYAFSSKIVMALGATCAAAGLAVFGDAAGLDAHALPFLVGALALPAFFFLAYRYQNAFLLIVAVLGLFHWVGSWTGMLGRNEYDFDVQDPWLMSVAALAVFGVGLWHERRQERFLRFFQVYEALALVYLNLSLLILSIWPGHVLEVVLFTAATLAQLVVGARLQSGLVLGFGVTFAAIDLFTRYFERFWDKLDLGLFLLIGGGALLACGAAIERLVRARRAPEAA